MSDELVYWKGQSIQRMTRDELEEAFTELARYCEAQWTQHHDEKSRIFELLTVMSRP